MATKLGMDCVLYQGSSGETSLAAMSAVDNAQDVTLSMSAGEADTTTRGNDGWRSTTATLKEATVEFVMQFDTTDTVFDAIQTAFLDSAPLAFGVMDGPRTESGSSGPIGDWAITRFDRREALEETVKYDVTLKLKTFVEIHEVA